MKLRAIHSYESLKFETRLHIQSFPDIKSNNSIVHKFMFPISLCANSLCAHRNDQTLRGPLLYAQKFKSIHQAGDTSLVEKSSAQYDSVKK